MTVSVCFDASNRNPTTRGDNHTDLFPRDEFDKGFDSSYR